MNAERQPGRVAPNQATPPTAGAPVSKPAPGVPAPMSQSSPAESTTARHHVHNSYIWLGSIRATGALAIVILITSLASITDLLELVTLASPFRDKALTALLAIAAIVVVLVLIGAVMAGLCAWSWRHLWYEVGLKEVSVYSGIISKKRVHVPYDRIQTVDQKATLLQRIFGVCNVSIDTAGGASNKAVLIPYLRKYDAEALRHEIYVRKMGVEGAAPASSAAAGAVVTTAQPAPPQAETRFTGVAPAPAPPTGTPVSAPPPTQPAGNILDAGEEIWSQLGGVFAGGSFVAAEPSFECRLSNKELVFTGLSSASGFVAAVLVLVCLIAEILGLATGFIPNELDSFSTDASASFDAAATFAFNHPLVIAASIVAIIVVVILIWAFTVLATCVQYGGFHARRRGTRIEVERGLLQHQTESLDIKRVQSVVIRQTFIRRLIGYCELSLGKVAAGQSSDDTNAKQAIALSVLVVHPFVKTSRVPEILDGLVPEFSDIPEATTRLAPVAARRGLIRRCIWQGSGFWTGVCVGIVQALLHLAESFDPSLASALPALDAIFVALYVLAVILFAIDVISTVFWYRESACATNRHFARVKNGGLSSVDISIPRQKIQFMSTKTNPFQRLAGTATIRMRTAAGVGGTTTQLIDVSAQNAEAWLAWAEPRA